MQNQTLVTCRTGT